MLQCLSFQSSSATSASVPNSPATINLCSPPPPSQGTSVDGTTPVTSTQSSPTVNLTREYTLALQTKSYNEMWSISRVYDEEQNTESTIQMLLQPNRECVEEALSHAKPNALTRLVSDYFDHSENATQLCFLLRQSVTRARAIYAPIHKLVEVLPVDCESMTQMQFDCAYDLFLQFDEFDNPFPSRESQNFGEIQCCFSELKQQLDHRLQKSRSRVRLFRRATAGCALCAIGSVLAAAAIAVAIASHALVALVATPLCTVTSLPRNLTKKQLAHIKQLDAAARGTYVLNKDLDTIDCLVARLHDAVEGDKDLIRLGKDRHAITYVLKQLQKNHLNFLLQLKDLEEHICLCFNAVNRARSLLLQEIQHNKSFHF